MSTEDQNTTTVRELYQAFGRGDVPAVLALVDEKATWANPYGKGRFPGQWGKPCRGRNEILAFFQAINDAVEVRGFEPYELIAQRDKVVALINWNGVVRRTGQAYQVMLAHIWTLRDGRIVDYIGLDDPTAYAF
jgi:ketosteroid isomerase-like protein